MLLNIRPLPAINNLIRISVRILGPGISCLTERRKLSLSKQNAKGKCKLKVQTNSLSMPYAS